VFHEHGIAGEDRGYDHIDRNRGGIVPGGDIEPEAHGLASNEATKAFLFGQDFVRERFGSDRAEMLDAFDHRAFELTARLAERLAHHARDFFGIAVEARRVGREHSAAERDAFGDRGITPGAARRGGEFESSAHGCIVEEVKGIGGLTVGGAGDFRHLARVCCLAPNKRPFAPVRSHFDPS